MRARELERDRRATKMWLATNDEIREGIANQTCPFCKDGVKYRILALHIEQMHGISAYEFREMIGLNRGTSICDPVLSLELSDIHKNMAKPEFMAYDRSQIAAFREADWRPEGQAHKKEVARTPEAQERFKAAMDRVDRKAVAQRIPPEVRSASSKEAYRGLVRKRGIGWVRENCLNARAQLTPEAIHRRSVNAAKTMRGHFNDPQWHTWWVSRVKDGAQSHAKLSIEDRQALRSDVATGLSVTMLARKYGVTTSRVYQVRDGK